MIFGGLIIVIAYPINAGGGIVPPPLTDDFLLSDGTDFLLSDGTNFLLSGD
jgi:hypothetical protein